MRWEYQPEMQRSKSKTGEGSVLDQLLEARGYQTKKAKEGFLDPPDPADLTLKDFGVGQAEVSKAVARIRQAITKREQLVVYGDYDADGICASAILWESLYQLTPNVLPYLPERVAEGYGFNLETVKRLKQENPGLKLIITVDQGVTASAQIKKTETELGVDVIVCDHHQLPARSPQCTALVHATKICASGLAWVLSRECCRERGLAFRTDALELVAIATIADLEPLTGVNRSLAKFGLAKLNQTRRPGLLALLKEAGIEKGAVGTYEVGFIIGPRLNAMGRMAHALESLRLLCTRKEGQALDLARVLDQTNKERQALTQAVFQHSRELLLQGSTKGVPKLIFIAHESYQEGVIGLAAGKLTEEFHRPSVVISLGEQYSKASARSINGYNIIEAIREHEDLLLDVGGHPLAAGFTVETAKIALLKERLLSQTEQKLGPALLERCLKIDLPMPLSGVNWSLWQELQKMAPFGLGNPEPVFSSRAKINSLRLVGTNNQHLKLLLTEVGPLDKGAVLPAIGFNRGYLAGPLVVGQTVEVAYNLSINQWNGQGQLELKLKDIHVGS